MSIEEKKKNDFKKTSEDMDEIVCVIDKIGSGFEETEETALALLLFFKKKRILDKLSSVRHILNEEMAHLMTAPEFDEWIERDREFWKPPYNKSKEELLSLVKSTK